MLSKCSERTNTVVKAGERSESALWVMSSSPTRKTSNPAARTVTLGNARERLGSRGHHYWTHNGPKFFIPPSRSPTLAARGESPLIVSQVRAIKCAHGNGEEKAAASKGFMGGH